MKKSDLVSFPLAAFLLPSLGILLTLPLPAQTPDGSLSADRPDATESPYTVAPGRWQVEADAVVYERDASIPDARGDRRESWALGVTNFKYGIAPRLDLQAVIEPYRKESYEVNNGPETTHEGFGDVTLRLKWRLTDPVAPGEGAWAFLPYVKVPTADEPLGNGAFEGGFVFPYGRALADGWSFGFQAGTEWRRSEPGADETYALTPMATVVLGQELTESWGLFYEVAAAVDTEASSDAWEVTLNGGATYALTDDAQWDIGTFVGITRAAPDVTLFTGYTQRW